MPPHAIHGTTLRRAWRCDAVTDRTIRLSIDLGSDWPFPGEARQEIALDGLAAELGVARAQDGDEGVDDLR